VLAVDDWYFPDRPNRRGLREWWHSILRNYDRYACYAIFLILPSDKEAIRYLTHFGQELQVISGRNCLVLALGKDEVGRVMSFYDRTRLLRESRISKIIGHLWSVTIRKQVSEGYSIQVARLFEIDLTRFPCVLFFEDIRSREHAIVTLNGMSAEEIAKLMRFIFAMIDKAVADHKSPLDVLIEHQHTETFRRAGRTVLAMASRLVGKTLDKAIEAAFRSVIK
jgi:hypothetical protein